ncbi:hypothetical protein PC118_g13838 [Phytophthora cactorum]|uniref:AGC-kinase C-terminal domain-containing protein n=1 Tax=Phytophthora cactorum TaxID=29920 RepID=A0A8T1FHL5_9STRA|nr:hypothetical protein PC118_g13838 [Phytophthora cactorum]
MAAVLSPASLTVHTTSDSHANSSTKKRPLSPPRPLDEVPDVSAEDLTTPRPVAAVSSSVSPKNDRLTAAQAMEHPFFTLSLNWDELIQRQVTPPIVPVCHGCDCTDNFDDDFTKAPVVSLKLQSGDLVKRVRRDDCSCPVPRADEFQDF